MWCVGDSFLLGLHVGAWRHVVKPIQLKTHQRPAKSLFRYGFDGTRRALLNAADKWEQLEHVLGLLWRAIIAPKAPVHPLYPI